MGSNKSSIDINNLIELSKPTKYYQILLPKMSLGFSKYMGYQTFLVTAFTYQILCRLYVPKQRGLREIIWVTSTSPRRLPDNIVLYSLNFWMRKNENFFDLKSFNSLKILFYIFNVFSYYFKRQLYCYIICHILQVESSFTFF